MTLTQYIAHLQERITEIENMIAVTGNVDIVDMYGNPPIQEVRYNAENDRCDIA